MTRPLMTMPDFAGVALVDILANGVAMLIIVIVVSIAARVERDEHYAEQADEVATVMSHKFSTSLVLNTLAASPPAVLHDYDTSSLDQVLDPEVLPILELHPGFVREFYSGAIWPRRELLKEYSSMSAWLAGFTQDQKLRLRVDIYDVAQFYLAMSILREHGIRVPHWHFLTGSLSISSATTCPPGVAGKDCPGGGGDGASPLPPMTLGKGGAATAGGAGAGRGGAGDPDWPGFDAPSGSGGGTQGLLPGGVVPGVSGLSGAAGRSSRSGADGSGRGGPGGVAARPSAAGLGSFPNAYPGAARNGGASGSSGSAGSRRVNFRIALPDFVRRAVGAGADGIPSLEVIFGAMLHYLGELQSTLDSDGTPSGQIAGFSRRILSAFRAPPPLTEAERTIARELAVKFALLDRLKDSGTPTRALAFRPVTLSADGDSVLAVTPNRVNVVVGVGGGEWRHLETDVDRCRERCRKKRRGGCAEAHRGHAAT